MSRARRAPDGLEYLRGQLMNMPDDELVERTVAWAREVRDPASQELADAARVVLAGRLAGLRRGLAQYAHLEDPRTTER